MDRIKAGNYEEDPKQIVEGLLKVAANYEEEAKNVPADGDAEIFYTQFNYNTIVRQRALRDEDD